tara:strand:- start:681 stop:1751 length:1071 start_codon:yes stop_codon:yes gene_type:complete
MTKKPVAKPQSAPLTEIEAHDNSQITDYRMCERRFYFRHERGLVSTSVNTALVFGSSWHCAMDVVWPMINGTKATDVEVAEAAMDAFLEYWCSYELPDIEEFASLSAEEQKYLEPRTPMVALEMIFNYIKERRSFIESVELVETERPFLVPIDPNDPSKGYTGKMDKTIRMNGRIRGIEHKTTSLYRRDGPFRKDFMESFFPNSQVEGYLFTLHMLYGSEAKDIWIDAALVHKAVNDEFRFLPVEHMLPMLDAWLWETHERFAKIEEDQRKLREYRDFVNEGGSHLGYLPAFPKKPEACMLYGACPYLDLCRSWENPEAHPDEDAESIGEGTGYKVEFWSPFAENELEKLGYKEKK